MIDIKTAKKQDRAALVAELEKAGAVFRAGNSYCCPFHKKPHEAHPSAAVFESDTGWRFKCHACKETGDVWDVIAHNEGQTLGDVLKSVKTDSGRSGGKVMRTNKSINTKQVFDYEGILAAVPGERKKSFAYGDPDGNMKMLIIRSETGNEKTFRQARPENGGFVFGAPAKPWPLYNSTPIKNAETVVIVEGEKCADALGYFGFTATTSPGGYANATNAIWAGLSGKRVVFWRDNDDPGEQYQKDVIQCLFDLPTPPASVRVIDPDKIGLGHKDDAADFCRVRFDAGKTEDEIKAEIQDVIDNAEPIKRTGAADDLQGLWADIGAGKLRPIETGFRLVDSILQVVPGTLNLDCGAAGSRKSLWEIQKARKWHKEGKRVAIYELEKDRSFHLRRAFAQESGYGLLTKNRWVESNIELVQKLTMEHFDFLESFGRVIDATPEKMVYQKDVLDWARRKADSGFKILIVDPATKAIRQGDVWTEDEKFVCNLQEIATTKRVAICLVLHPTKQVVTMPDLALISGGKAYGNFCDNACWLEGHEPKASLIKFCTGTAEAKHNATLHILKSREDGGTGARIALDFNAEDLTLRELGRIEKRSKKVND